MSLNSVNTNMGAMIALQSLNRTNTDLGSVQKQVSTGYRVADATDDGAAFAVAQSVRSTVGALTTANQQLGNVQGLLSTSQSSLTNVSNTMSSMRDVLVKLADSNVSGSQRSQYATQYQSLAANVKTAFQDANYSGKSLVGGTGANGWGRVATVRNETGATYGLSTFNGAGIFTAINFGTAAAGTLMSATAAASALSSGAFVGQMDKVSTALNTIGSESNYVTSQVSYNSDKIDALNSGLGSLVDADLAKESAQLQALQIRQQLGTQALSMANQAPQTLLSLFK
jgi:flagellin